MKKVWKPILTILSFLPCIQIEYLNGGNLGNFKKLKIIVLEAIKHL